ncbi:MAG: ferritin [Candidatus Omnitrophota bacterium]
MDKKLEQAINEQIQKELYSAYLYLSMAAYLDAESLDGSAKWMKVQAKEEVAHGMKLYEFLNDRGHRVVLGAIDKPPADFSSVQEIFEETLKHEKKVTVSIHNLYALAEKVDDTAAKVFLHWFIEEQVEEEKNASDILGKLKYIGKQSSGILMLDKALGKRGEK